MSVAACSNPFLLRDKGVAPAIREHSPIRTNRQGLPQAPGAIGTPACPLFRQEGTRRAPWRKQLLKGDRGRQRVERAFLTAGDEKCGSRKQEGVSGAPQELSLAKI